MRRSFLRSGYFHLLLFIITLFTTTLAGSELVTGRQLFIPSPDGIYLNDDFNLSHFLKGFYYSVPFLLILTAHEFGHYFMAVYHKVRTTLPYYIPIYLGPMLNIGTMGAVIRIKERIDSRKVFFDIGIAGPLAGFVVAIGFLWYGFTHLPPKEYVFSIHPEYREYGLDYEKKVYTLDFYNKLAAKSLGHEDYELNTEPLQIGVTIGDNLLFYFFKNYVNPNPELYPNQFEVLHYPYILVGFLALFFTALNLIPVGQLDGGHILYGLIGDRNHRIVSACLFTGLILYGGTGLITLEEILKEPSETLLINLPLYLLFLYFIFSKITPNYLNNILLAVSVFTLQFLFCYFFPNARGNFFWLVYGLILSKVLGIYHPPTPIEEPLDLKRKVLGWVALFIFVISFSPEPLKILQISS